MNNLIIHTYFYLSGNQKLICMLCCILLWGCTNNSKSKTPDIDNYISDIEIINQQKSDMPEILFDHLSYDFGEITQGEQRSYIFYFKNVGKSNLIIYNVDTSCGCTSSMFSKDPVLPKKEGEIAITFDSKGKSGKISNHVVVSANTYPAQIVLTLHANVVNP